MNPVTTRAVDLLPRQLWRSGNRWLGRAHFCVGGDAEGLAVRSIEWDDRTIEERITLWPTAAMDEAIRRAEAEAAEDAQVFGSSTVDLAEAYLLCDDPRRAGAEVFSRLWRTGADDDQLVAHLERPDRR